MIEITPEIKNYKSVFFAGTIDNGDSVNWQQELTNEFSKDSEIIIYNPRNKHWDKNTSDIDYQIKWEQEHLDKSDLIVMVLLDDSKSSISLLELGLYAQSKKIIVFCSNKFYRFDNVKLTCEKYNIPLYTKFDTNIIYKQINIFLNK